MDRRPAEATVHVCGLPSCHACLCHAAYLYLVLPRTKDRCTALPTAELLSLHKLQKSSLVASEFPADKDGNVRLCPTWRSGSPGTSCTSCWSQHIRRHSACSACRGCIRSIRSQCRCTGCSHPITTNPFYHSVPARSAGNELGTDHVRTECGWIREEGSRMSSNELCEQQCLPEVAGP